MSDYEPRNACFHYFFEHGIGRAAKNVSKAEFDKLCETWSFEDGPFVETFGDGYGEPYNPFRQAFGLLKDGRGVFCEMHESRQPVEEPEKGPRRSVWDHLNDLREPKE